MPHEFSTSYLTDAISVFRQYKLLAEKAMAQVPDERLTHAQDEECNSIAVIVKHMAGNMRSRWTNFLTTDGEKPDRNRDSEFVEPPKNRAELMRTWEQGWTYVFDALTPLTESDLSRTITIRGEPHSVMQAINRQLCHYSQHIGQIVLLAKQLRAGEWNTLSLPRKKQTS